MLQKLPQYQLYYKDFSDLKTKTGETPAPSPVKVGPKLYRFWKKPSQKKINPGEAVTGKKFKKMSTKKV